MDALYSLRSRSTSRDSVDSFDLISTDSASTKQTAHVHAHLSDSEFASDVYDDDDWEVLSDDDNEHNNNSTDDALTVDEPSAAIEPNVRVLQTHFDVSADANASDAKAPREPECEPELEATRPQPLTQAHRAKEVRQCVSVSYPLSSRPRTHLHMRLCGAVSRSRRSTWHERAKQKPSTARSLSRHRHAQPSRVVSRHRRRSA